MNNDWIIQATGVHKVYHTGLVSVPALRGIDLSVRRGEMLAVMGPSGCGKTTLLNCLSGLDTADEGQIAIEGRFSFGDVGPRAHRLPRPADGFRLPVLQSAAGLERGGKRRAAAAGLRREAAGGASNAPWKRWRRSGWQSAPTTARQSFPAGSGSAQRLHAPW